MTLHDWRKNSNNGTKWNSRFNPTPANKHIQNAIYDMIWRLIKSTPDKWKHISRLKTKHNTKGESKILSQQPFYIKQDKMKLTTALLLLASVSAVGEPWKLPHWTLSLGREHHSWPHSTPLYSFPYVYAAGNTLRGVSKQGCNFSSSYYCFWISSQFDIFQCLGPHTQCEHLFLNVILFQLG